MEPYRLTIQLAGITAKELWTILGEGHFKKEDDLPPAAMPLIFASSKYPGEIVGGALVRKPIYQHCTMLVVIARISVLREGEGICTRALQMLGAWVATLRTDVRIRGVMQYNVPMEMRILTEKEKMKGMLGRRSFLQSYKAGTGKKGGKSHGGKIVGFRYFRELKEEGETLRNVVDDPPVRGTENLFHAGTTEDYGIGKPGEANKACAWGPLWSDVSNCKVCGTRMVFAGNNKPCWCPTCTADSSPAKRARIAPEEEEGGGAAASSSSAE